MRSVKSLLSLSLAILSLSNPHKVGAVERVDSSPGPKRMTREESQLKLHWVTENSLELQFPDGSKTKILLRPTSNIQDEATPCLFTGQLEDDLDSRVTVSGCLGDEETVVTIASSKVDGGVVDLSFTGTATYQLGLIVSADSLSRAADVIHPGNVRRSRRSTSGDTEESDIKLEWVTDGEEIKITFANGAIDKILLYKVDDIEDVDVGCLFTGVLDGDHDSEVDVDGCKSDAETIVEIQSFLVPCGFVDLLLTKADTYILKQDEEHIPDLVKGEEANDALTIPADATDVPQENVRPWPTHKELPKVASLETRVKYDKGLVDATGGVLEAKRFISRAVEHAKTRLHMLPIKVELSVVGTMKYVQNQNWRANGQWINRLKDSNADKVVSHFCAGGAAGIAYVGAVCGGAYGVNINEHINWPGRAEWVTGRTFAHELGHNLGMWHDFDSKHGGNGQPGSRGRCDGQGLMSYGSCKPSCRDSRMPDRWSECSVADFERTFRSSTHRCLAMGQGDTPHPEAGCTCNGYIHRGRGECKNQASCGNWCYVDEGNSCSYSYRSYIGSPHRWTCEACDNSRTAKVELVAPPCTATAFSLTVNLLVFSVAASLIM